MYLMDSGRGGNCHPRPSIYLLYFDSVTAVSITGMSEYTVNIHILHFAAQQQSSSSYGKRPSVRSSSEGPPHCPVSLSSSPGMSVSFLNKSMYICRLGLLCPASSVHDSGPKVRGLQLFSHQLPIFDRSK